MYLSYPKLRIALFGVLAVAGLSLSLILGMQVRDYRVEPGFPRLVYVPGYQEGPRISADSAVLIDEESGAILYARAEHVRRAPASTTKILTALIAIEYGDLNSVVTISRRAASISGTSLHLRTGDRMTLGELVKGVLMCSGNDGSASVAEHLAGTESEFARRMTAKAHELGALNSQFKNAHGLRAVGHYSTAYDLALLARHAMQNPVFAGLVGTREATLSWEDREECRKINNTNRLLWTLEGADGVKTGTTNQAGKCLVASATRNQRRLIAVVLHSGDRWGDAARLLEHGFGRYTLAWGARENVPVAVVPVKGGHVRQVPLIARNPVCMPVPVDQIGEIRQVIEVPRELKAPLRPGQIVGKVGLYLGDLELITSDLIVKHPVKRRFLWWTW